MQIFIRPLKHSTKRTRKTSARIKIHLCERFLLNEIIFSTDSFRRAVLPHEAGGGPFDNGREGSVSC